MPNGQPLPKESISSGIDSLDALISAIPIGDNVVWEVDAGTSYDSFIHSFIARSFGDSQKVIYVSFNRSPQTVLSGLGKIISPEHFTLVDCFTSGKGKNDSTFVKFYEKDQSKSVVRIESPRDIDRFTATLNDIEDNLPPGARYVFDSLTGMQDLWGDESETHRFFTYMCPRLYDLRTVAYWILEKDAHSPKFKANLRHITQVVFDLYKRKNALFIKAIKLEGRQSRDAFAPHQYEVRVGEIVVSLPRKEPVVEVGGRIREARTRQGISQKELADRANVTPSFLSQLESNQVSPSLPTFVQICRALGLNPGQFLDVGKETPAASWLLRKEIIVSRPPVREDAAKVYDVLSGDRHAVRIVVLPPGAAMNRHFFYHKEEELIYVLKGELSVTVGGREERIGTGDMVRLKESFPSRWKNEGGGDAELLVQW
jgi:transcriptional regulator with XRE-family HTH domain